MSVTSLICTYIYGTFQVICGAIEAYQEMAKGMLEKIEEPGEMRPISAEVSRG